MTSYLKSYSIALLAFEARWAMKMEALRSKYLCDTPVYYGNDLHQQILSITGVYKAEVNINHDTKTLSISVGITHIHSQNEALAVTVLYDVKRLCEKYAKQFGYKVYVWGHGCDVPYTNEKAGIPDYHLSVAKRNLAIAESQAIAQHAIYSKEFHDAFKNQNT